MFHRDPTHGKAVAMSDAAETDDFIPNADRFLEADERWAKQLDPSRIPGAPSKRVAVVACMDCRLPVEKILGIEPGEAHVIRNAGGVLTDDVIRSLTLSQRALGTREIVLIHHTDCGLQKVTEDEFVADLEAATGARPDWIVGAFDDPFDDTAESMAALAESPFLPHKDHIRGFVYDVDTGKLLEVTAD